VAGVVDDISPAVAVEEEGGIYAVDFRQPHRIGPGPGRILCGDEKFSAAVDQLLIT